VFTQAHGHLSQGNIVKALQGLVGETLAKELVKELASGDRTKTKQTLLKMVDKLPLPEVVKQGLRGLVNNALPSDPPIKLLTDFTQGVLMDVPPQGMSQPLAA